MSAGPLGVREQRALERLADLGSWVPGSVTAAFVLGVLVGRGFVERRITRSGSLYRITDAGRRYLAAVHA